MRSIIVNWTECWHGVFGDLCELKAHPEVGIGCLIPDAGMLEVDGDGDGGLRAVVEDGVGGGEFFLADDEVDVAGGADDAFGVELGEGEAFDQDGFDAVGAEAGDAFDDGFLDALVVGDLGFGGGFEGVGHGAVLLAEGLHAVPDDAGRSGLDEVGEDGGEFLGGEVEGWGVETPGLVVGAGDETAEFFGGVGHEGMLRVQTSASGGV